MFGSQKFISQFFIFICVLFCVCAVKGSDEDENDRYKSFATPRAQAKTPRPLDTISGRPLKEEDQSKLNDSLAYLTRLKMSLTCQKVTTFVLGATTVALVSFNGYAPGVRIGLRNYTGWVSDEQLPRGTPWFLALTIGYPLFVGTVLAYDWVKRLPDTFYGMFYDSFLSWFGNWKVPSEARGIIEEITHREHSKFRIYLYRATQVNELLYYTIIVGGTMLVVEGNYEYGIQLAFAGSGSTLVYKFFIAPTNAVNRKLKPSCCNRAGDKVQKQRFTNMLKDAADLIRLYGPTKETAAMGDAYNVLTMSLAPAEDDALVKDRKTNSPLLTEAPPLDTAPLATKESSIGLVKKEPYAVALDKALDAQNALPRHVRWLNRVRERVSSGLSYHVAAAFGVGSPFLVYLGLQFFTMHFGGSLEMAQVIGGIATSEFGITLSPLTIASKARLLVKEELYHLLEGYLPKRVVGGTGFFGWAKYFGSRFGPIVLARGGTLFATLPVLWFIEDKVLSNENTGYDIPLALIKSASIPVGAVVWSAVAPQFNYAWETIQNWVFTGLPIRLPCFPKFRLCCCCNQDVFEEEEQLLETIDRVYETKEAYTNLNQYYRQGVDSQVNMDKYVQATYQLEPNEEE